MSRDNAAKWDELWKAIQRSPFFGVYVSEMYWLAKYVEQETDKIFSETPPSPKPGQEYIHVDHTLHNRIQSVLLAAARTRSLILNRDRDGSRNQKEVLVRRTAVLQKLVEGIDLSPVLNGAARNSIEHFDEYIDRVAIKSYKGDITRPTLFPVNLVLSTRRCLEQFNVGGARPTIYFIRAYIADERVFSNCGRELPLGPLRECGSAIRKRLEPLLPTQSEQGGSILVITAKAFNPR
jgi:hypothetical protein